MSRSRVVPDRAAPTSTTRSGVAAFCSPAGCAAGRILIPLITEPGGAAESVSSIGAHPNNLYPTQGGMWTIRSLPDRYCVRTTVKRSPELVEAVNVLSATTKLMVDPSRLVIDTLAPSGTVPTSVSVGPPSMSSSPRKTSGVEPQLSRDPQVRQAPEPPGTNHAGVPSGSVTAAAAAGFNLNCRTNTGAGALLLGTAAAALRARRSTA